VRPVLVIVIAVLALPGSAHGGGSIRGFVLLPAQGRLAVFDADAGKVLRTVSVPRGAGPVAASIDGSRVLVANTRLGTVTEIDGRIYRHVRTFTGLGRPVDLVLLPRPEVGLVRPRYAVVADARGWVDILDLVVGRIVNRISVPHPLALALSDPQLWVSSAGRTTLTQLDVSTPARTRVAARPDAGVVPAALASDPTGIAVDVSSRNGTLVRVDAVSLARTVVKHLGGNVTQLLTGYQGVVWAAEADGRVLGVKASKGRILHVMDVPRRSRLGIVGGWLAAARGHSLRMSVLGTGGRAKAVSLPGDAGDFAFAVP
jgi:DNA-binding beta-propeller fold protein YncE